MRITYNSNQKIWVAESSYSEKDAVKQAGFWWHPKVGSCSYQGCQACAAGLVMRWWTHKPESAAKLIDYCDDEAKQALKPTVKAIEGSKASDSSLRIPCPDGLEYMPFQKAGIEYAAGRLGTLIADEMGLGKTIQAVGLINFQAFKKVLIVVPASLRLNWLRELNTWLVDRDSFVVTVVDSATTDITHSDIVIINYDRIKGERFAELMQRNWDLLIVDEAHSCFPAGTMVTTQDGEMDIAKIVNEQLSVSVASCNLSSNVLEYKPVQGWFKFRTNIPLVEVTHAHGKFSCTEDHKIWTDQGYTEASALTSTARLRILQHHVLDAHQRKNHSEVLWKKVCCDKFKQSSRGARSNIKSFKKTRSRKDMCLVQECISFSFKGLCKQSSKKILQRELCGFVESIPARKHWKIQTSSRRFTPASYARHETARLCRTHAKQQPDEKSCLCRKNEKKDDRSNLFSTGWKWKTNKATTIISRYNRIANGISYINRTCERLLQVPSVYIRGRSSRSKQEVSNRSGRKNTQATQVEIPGQTQNSSFIYSRMVSSKVYKRGSVKECTSSSKEDQIVYCVSVLDNENFFANGVLVSNCKNNKAKRTQAVLGSYDRRKGTKIAGLVDKAKYKLFLTGTPILNRPIEIQSIAGALAPKLFGNYFAFGKRYADGHQTKFGWDFSGASNLEELQDRLRSSIMVRRLKKDVLTELPPKTRTIVLLNQNGMAEIVEREQSLFGETSYTYDLFEEVKADAELALANNDQAAYNAAVSRLDTAIKVAFEDMASIRHELAVAKVPAVIEHLDDLLESVDKLVVFAHHKDVITALQAHYGNASVVLDGGTPNEERQAVVDRFQTDPSCKVFIGSIHAAGVGITLTAASHVVFAELDWVPANMMQAEDRCHRIGQRDNVTVQHLVVDGSLDAKLAETLVWKQKIIEQALDNSPSKIEVPAIEQTSVKPPPLRYPVATQVQRDACAEALQHLVSICDGAFKQDGMGFNKFDATLGRKLAYKASERNLTDGEVSLCTRMLPKYIKQLGQTLIDKIKG